MVCTQLTCLPALQWCGRGPVVGCRARGLSGPVRHHRQAGDAAATEPRLTLTARQCGCGLTSSIQKLPSVSRQDLPHLSVQLTARRRGETPPAGMPAGGSSCSSSTPPLMPASVCSAGNRVCTCWQGEQRGMATGQPVGNGGAHALDGKLERSRSATPAHARPHAGSSFSAGNTSSWLAQTRQPNLPGQSCRRQQGAAARHRGTRTHDVCTTRGYIHCSRYRRCHRCCRRCYQRLLRPPRDDVAGWRRPSPVAAQGQRPEGPSGTQTHLQAAAGARLQEGKQSGAAGAESHAGTAAACAASTRQRGQDCRVRSVNCTNSQSQARVRQATLPV